MKRLKPQWARNRAIFYHVLGLQMATQQSRCKSLPLVLWKIDSVTNRFVGVYAAACPTVSVETWDSCVTELWLRLDPYGQSKSSILEIIAREIALVVDTVGCHNSMAFHCLYRTFGRSDFPKFLIERIQYRKTDTCGNCWLLLRYFLWMLQVFLNTFVKNNHTNKYLINATLEAVLFLTFTNEHTVCIQGSSAILDAFKYYLG